MAPNKADTRAVVVGAGITGLSAALLLARKDIQVQVLETESVPGGLLAPVNFEGFELDRGSHRVHPESHPLLVELTREAEWQSQLRAGCLLLNGRQLSYPLDPIRFVAGLGVKTTASMAFGWLRRPDALKQTLNWESDRKEVGDDEGFEDFIVRRVGESAYRQFYEPYARKVWGIEPKDLSQTVAKQRVSTSNPAQSILRKTEKRFLYPKEGMASLIQLLRKKVEEAGGEVQLGSSFDVQSTNGAPVFYTGHLGDLTETSTLNHRGLYLLYVSLPEHAIGETDTWYVPESHYWFGRVSQPARFSDALSRPGERTLCIEIPEGTWGPDEDFVRQSATLMSQLTDAGIVQRKTEPLRVSQVFLPRVYPMYTRGWVKEQRRVLKEAASKQSIYPCGRQGLFLHCNMDQAVATASAAVEHWSSGGDALSWVDKCREFADFRVRD